MTIDETRKIIMGIMCSYPNFKPQCPVDMMITVWDDDLKDYTYEQVYIALKTFKATDKSGFAPTVGQIINTIYETSEISEYLLPSEAWALVVKATQRGNYNALEEFNKLPADVQKAVGSANVIKEWAKLSPDALATTAQNSFNKAYIADIEQRKKISRMPVEIRNQIEQKQQEMLEAKDV